MTNDASGDRIVGSQRVVTWAEETRRYRRSPGGWWWLALILIPLLLALLGTVIGGDTGTASAGGSTGAAAVGTAETGATTPDESAEGTSGTESGPDAAASSGSDPDASEPTSDAGSAAGATIASAVFAVTRSADRVTVRAEVPDDAAKSALLDAVAAGVADSAIIDEVTVTDGATAPDSGALQGALAAVSGAGDFGLAWDLRSLVATGEVVDEAAKTAIGEALASAWPDATIENSVTVGSGGEAACANLQGRITVALADTKITFERYGTEPDAATDAVLGRVAELAAACPDAKLTVTGYTDASGSDQENLTLSAQRAEAVAAVLRDNGVPEGQVTAVGKGEADPIADNDTPAGINANRRVEITVS